MEGATNGAKTFGLTPAPESANTPYENPLRGDPRYAKLFTTPKPHVSPYANISWSGLLIDSFVGLVNPPTFWEGFLLSFVGVGSLLIVIYVLAFLKRAWRSVFPASELPPATPHTPTTPHNPFATFPIPPTPKPRKMKSTTKCHVPDAIAKISQDISALRDSLTNITSAIDKRDEYFEKSHDLLADAIDEIVETSDSNYNKLIQLVDERLRAFSNNVDNLKQTLLEPLNSVQASLSETLESSLQPLRTGLQHDIDDLTRRIRDDLNDIVAAIPPPPTDNILTDEFLQDVAARMERIRVQSGTVASHPGSQVNSSVDPNSDMTESIRESSSFMNNISPPYTTALHRHSGTVTVSSPFAAPIPSTGVNFLASSPMVSVASYNQGPVSTNSLAQPPPSQFHVANQVKPSIHQNSKPGVSFTVHTSSPFTPSTAQPSANVPFQIILPSSTKLRVPPYDPKTMTADSFLDELEFHMRRKNLSDIDRLGHLHEIMNEGKATKDWWKRSRAIVKSWPHFLSAFRDFFGATFNIEEAREKLYNKVQGDKESFASYAFNTDLQYRRVFPEATDADAINFLIRHSKPTLRSSLLASQLSLKTFDDLVALGIQQEHALGTYTHSKPDPVSHKQNSGSSSTKSSDKTKSNNNNNLSAKKHSYTNNGSPSSGKRHCTFCDKPGHTKDMCFKNPDNHSQSNSTTPSPKPRSDKNPKPAKVNVITSAAPALSEAASSPGNASEAE